MSTTYVPPADSLAHKVCSHFRQHPDDELDVADIAQKFRAVGSQVDALLSGAVAHGLLNRQGRRGTGAVYLAGTLLAASAKPAPAAPPAPAAAPPAAAPKARRPRAANAPPDPAAVVIKSGVPLPKAVAGIGTGVYSAVLQRMKVNDMVELTSTQARSMSVSAKKLGIKVAIRRIDDARHGVWRLA
jgi:hypothetical protein